MKVYLGRILIATIKSASSTNTPIFYWVNDIAHLIPVTREFNTLDEARAAIAELLPEPCRAYLEYK